MSRASDLEREARHISDRLAAGETFADLRGDIDDVTTRLAKPGYTLHIDAYSALLRSPTGRSLSWVWNDRDTKNRDRRAARIRRELIEDCYCVVIYPGWLSDHGSPLHAHDDNDHDVHWPQTWREAETYLIAIDLADNRVPAIELVETWWSRTFDTDFLVPGSRGVDVDAGEPATLADYLHARDTARGTTPEQRAALTTARYLEESARREDLRWLLGQ